ncbi:cation diffusion facilitator family transporter [Enterobacteriaceae endosymbiont of Macroplea mutica]|uniref:cation diffusion facilitator family transporter n=1 Tax=Enterobacteriaceae endosymbiont of Macroplea mutica TaxID=2675791 RepID=UPI00144956B2|nr:cation diffusion facilitator family transporter [Enterobacteriaceae endosymbiont of Macroplea mutica]QJC31098.1 cation diffusion facilitator family transporter [Enterobacteriaceae endosymbiont of Macroplea mutica]
MNFIFKKLFLKHKTTNYNTLVVRITYCAILVSFILLILKIIAWEYTHSISMLASFIDSLIDITSSTINLLILYYSLQPADFQHSFGHGKAESLSALTQSVFICGTAIILFIHSIKYYSHPIHLIHPTIGIIVIIFSFFSTLLLVMLQKKVIKQTNSQSTHANMLHYQSDILINSAVLFAFICNIYNINTADPLITLCISILIFVNATKIVYKSIQSLLDQSLPDYEKKIIMNLINSWPKVLGAHELKTRQSGPTRFIQLHLVLDDKLSLLEAHAIAEEIELALGKKFPYSEILIHQDPYSIVPKHNQGFFQN